MLVQKHGLTQYSVGDTDQVAETPGDADPVRVIEDAANTSRESFEVNLETL